MDKVESQGKNGAGHNFPPLLVIVGPTAVGKTALTLELASQFDGEIVSADSRLLYRGLDIGTDKPSKEDRRRVPHHLIDICQPDDRISLGQYQRLACSAIHEIHERERLPILAGGTGQYVHAIVEGWSIPAVPPQEDLREALLKLGQSELARWLSALDPNSARKIDHRNVRRVIRALEVTLVKGVPMSTLQRRKKPKLDIKQLGLTGSRKTLFQKVDIRVDRMMKNGLLAEVISLRDQGYHRQLSSMSGLGYRQLLAFLEGETTLDEAVERIKFETHRFIRQQANWFRLDDRNIIWFDIENDSWDEQASEEVRRWLGGYSE